MVFVSGGIHIQFRRSARGLGLRPSACVDEAQAFSSLGFHDPAQLLLDRVQAFQERLRRRQAQEDSRSRTFNLDFSLVFFVALGRGS